MHSGRELNINNEKATTHIHPNYCGIVPLYIAVFNHILFSMFYIFCSLLSVLLIFCHIYVFIFVVHIFIFCLSTVLSVLLVLVYAVKHSAVEKMLFKYILIVRLM